MVRQLVGIGKITAPHGVNGNVKMRFYGDDCNAMYNYRKFFRKDGSALDLKVCGLLASNDAILIVAGVCDRNDARRLCGVEVYVDRDDMPDISDDEFYYCDFIDAKVLDSAGNLLGVVKDVMNFGAGDIVDIQCSDGESLLCPVNETFFPVINLEEGFVVVSESVIEGR